MLFFLPLYANQSCVDFGKALPYLSLSCLLYETGSLVPAMSEGLSFSKL